MGRSWPAGTTILWSVPSMGASTSVVTLSVSTISKGSPLARLSPSCFNHSRTVPDSMV